MGCSTTCRSAIHGYQAWQACAKILLSCDMYRTYICTHTKTPGSTWTTCHNHMPCTKAWVICHNNAIPPLTYITIISQHQLLQATHSRQSLLYFSQQHIPFMWYIILHEEETMVRNMLQPTSPTHNVLSQQRQCQHNILL